VKHSLLYLFLLLPALLFAQETTGTLKGIVTDSLNQPLGGATILVTQQSTGARYGTITQENGFFIFNQLQPDNSYRLQVGFPEYQAYAEDGIAIALGRGTVKNITLHVAHFNLAGVEITSNEYDPIKNPKKGNETTLKGELITRLPTLNRSIQDATRILPESNLNSFGGANYRFNNLSIDGSATNDVLGFQEPASGAAGSVASGTPGGLAGTQPIGYGAISALSIKTAPFDVTYGNFTGASINAVTKSGTNELSGNVYAFGRNDWLLGRRANGEVQPSGDFSDSQMGLSIGGPIVKNEVLAFANAEYAFRREPVLNGPGTAESEIPLETVQEIRDTLMARYGYDPGAYQNVSLDTRSLKLFGRLDFNLSQKHKLTLRDNYVTGYADRLEWTPNFFNYGNQGYRHTSRTNSLVAEFKSTFKDNLYNKLTLSHTTVTDSRDFEGRVFPHIEINYNTANTIFAGTYREAAIYGLTLSTTQFTDNLTYYKNKHIVTAGISAEFNAIQYRFLTAWNGRWQYKSVQDFFDETPNRVRGVYNIGNNDFEFNRHQPSADYGVLLGGIYVQDELRLHHNLSLTAGLRADIQWHPGEFPMNPDLHNTPEFAAYQNKLNTSPQLNPRLGFNWVMNDVQTLLLRGGSGLFTGRIPFVWYAYIHYISGTQYFNIDLKPTGQLPLTENLADLAAIQPSLTEINLVDNNFTLPRDWKNNLALEIKLPGNTFIGIEGTYTKVLSGLLFQSINFKDSIGQFTGADDRPYYLASGSTIKLNPEFTNVFLLTNVHQGYRYNLSLNITKRLRNYTGFVGYTFGESKDITSTVRNSHAANYEWNQSIVANAPQLSYSNFDLRHKLVNYHLYERSTKVGKFSAMVIYTLRSGSPFSFVHEGDMNRDGSGKNDLIYIPRDASEINLVPIVDANGVETVSAATQWEQLNAYIEASPYLRAHRGQYAARNGARSPWNHQLDLRLAFQKPLNKGKHGLQFTVDLINAGNLISKTWGNQYYVPNVQNAGFGLMDFVRIQGGQPWFQFKNPAGTPWLVDPLNSRWQAQVGLQYDF
jgi:hypothetical protein